ncbi:MAG: hypothetical protein LIQ30_02590, partial [Planctomycetes bacterium]|nr:hypothetical protein [Planctomycetota bacterium]
MRINQPTFTKEKLDYNALQRKQARFLSKTKHENLKSHQRFTRQQSRHFIISKMKRCEILGHDCITFDVSNYNDRKILIIEAETAAIQIPEKSLVAIVTKDKFIFGNEHALDGAKSLGEKLTYTIGEMGNSDSAPLSTTGDKSTNKVDKVFSALSAVKMIVSPILALVAIHSLKGYIPSPVVHERFPSSFVQHVKINEDLENIYDENGAIISWFVFPNYDC